jgi:hypothetical protein
VRGKENIYPDENEQWYGKLPLGPVRSKKEKAGEDRNKVIRMAHHKAQDRCAKDEKVRQNKQISAFKLLHNYSS